MSLPRTHAYWSALAALWLTLLGSGEWAVRATKLESLALAVDERSLTYRHDRRLGWFPEEGTEKVFVGARTISVRHNRDGFRDHEYGEKTRPRIAFLGDSFVWGYDVENDERFTAILQANMPGWEILNWGVSGYGTDQQYLLTQHVLPKLQPDVVVLVYSLNDSRDNRSNQRYGPYYKPYFRIGADGLLLQGVPVPVCLPLRYRQHPLVFTSHIARGAFALLASPGLPARIQMGDDPTVALLQAERDVVEAAHARFALAFVETHKTLAAHAVAERVPFVDLSGAEQYPEIGHWTPDGHRFVADRLLNFLISNTGLRLAQDGRTFTGI